MQSSGTTDLQLSVSSFEATHNAIEGYHGDGFGWIPLPTDTDPWISMEFMRLAHVMGLTIVGKVLIFSFSKEVSDWKC